MNKTENLGKIAELSLILLSSLRYEKSKQALLELLEIVKSSIELTKSEKEGFELFILNRIRKELKA